MTSNSSIATNSLTLRALRLIGGDWRVVSRTIPVRVDRIVAEAWKPYRLQRAVELLAQGLRPPPVRLVGFRLGSTTIYEPSDGNHRVVAARQAGRTHIAAKVSGVTECAPERCAIRGQSFYERDVDGKVVYWEDDLADELLAELRRLGVETCLRS